MLFKNALLGSVAIVGLIGLGLPAHAQSAAVNSQIQLLQDQVHALNQQLQNLQSQVTQTVQSQAQDTAKINSVAASSNGIVAAMPNNRPTLSTADGQNSIALTGRLHYDMGAYPNYSPNRPNVAPNNLNAGVDLRRGRIGVLGKIAGDWNFGLIYDFGGTNDNGPATGSSAAATPSGGIETAELTYNGFRPFAVEMGYEDVPYTLDEATSSNDIMFTERASSQVIAANLAAGDFRSNVGGHWNSDRAWVGIYGTGGVSGSSHAGLGQQFGAVGRATYQLLQSDAYSLHVGADVEGLMKPESNAGVRSITTFTDRPEDRSDTTQILTAGTIGTAANPVSGANVESLELAGGLGSLFGQAEYFHYNVNRSNASTLSFNGGYAQASYTLTGEHRKYLPATGAYSGISPDHPFSITNGTWGAWEVAARYSVMDLNSHFTPGVTVASTNGVAGGQQQIATIGVNWYVNNNIRFLFDYLHGFIDKKSGVAATAPLGAGIGGRLDAVEGRAQVAF